MNKLLGQLLKKRGFSEDFLTPKYEDLIDARELPDMEKAGKRIDLWGLRCGWGDGGGDNERYSGKGGNPRGGNGVAGPL